MQMIMSMTKFLWTMFFHWQVLSSRIISVTGGKTNLDTFVSGFNTVVHRHTGHCSVHNDCSHQDHQHYQRISLVNSWSCECNSAYLDPDFIHMCSKHRCSGLVSSNLADWATQGFFLAATYTEVVRRSSVETKLRLSMDIFLTLFLNFLMHSCWNNTSSCFLHMKHLLNIFRLRMRMMIKMII